jgi:ABC-type nitrate/sulfonate/bicarbonate transport system permease component
MAHRKVAAPSRASGLELLAGYGLANIIGAPLGILMGRYHRFDAALTAIIFALQCRKLDPRCCRQFNVLQRALCL